jgi:hypothetical protein
MTITAAQQAQLEKASTQTLYFVELQFAESTRYLCSANISVSWNGKVSSRPTT